MNNSLVDNRRRGLLISAVAFGCFSLLIGFIGLPLVSLVVWTAEHQTWRSMLSPVAVEALSLSLRTTAVAMILVVLVGTPSAYILARVRFPGRRVLDALIDIPAVLPPSAAGIALLLAFGRMGLIGERLSLLGVQIGFTTAAVVMAELFVAAHFYVRQASLGFGSGRRIEEEAAMVDGAGSLGVFFRVTIPLALPALVAGAVMAWARALGEFGATIIFAGNLRGVTQTMPLAIFSALESDFNVGVALSVLMLAFAFAVIFTARGLAWRVDEYRR